MINSRNFIRNLVLLIVAVATVGPPAPAAAAGALSDVLTDQILEMHRFDMNRRLEEDFEQRKKALGDQETVERATKMRALLKGKADAYERLEDYDRAEAAYTEAIDVRPLDPIVYSDRGYFLMRQGRFSDAVRDFVAGSRAAPTQGAYNYGAGRALARMGDYAAAIQHYDEAIRLEPHDSAPVVARAEALVQLNRFADARADYDLALDLGLHRPGDRFFVHFGRGYVNIALGEFAGAIRDLDVALTARPKMVHAMVWRGYAHERMGQRDLALGDYETAARFDPDDRWIRASIKRVRS